LDVLEAIKGRRSVRRFCQDDVPGGLILELLTAASMAPSAHNRQPWEFLVTTDPAKRRLLAGRTYARHLEQAPVAIVASLRGVSRRSRMAQRMVWLGLQDVSAAIENLMLAAHALGLGTCWIGDFDEVVVREAFKIPADRMPVAVIALGWPDGTPKAPKRKPVEDILVWESYPTPAGG
jgi:nitroreductase